MASGREVNAAQCEWSAGPAFSGTPVPTGCGNQCLEIWNRR